MITEEENKVKHPLLLGVYDCMFKAIMLDPDNRDYLRGIIHYITSIPLSELENIIVENSEYLINNKNDKKMCSDIIISVGNRYINIEMNKDYYEGIFRKDMAYFEKISANIYNNSEDYINSKEVIQICFDNFSHFQGNQEIYIFTYKEETKNFKLPENPVRYYVDLAYIRKMCYNKPVVNLSKLEKYCLLLLSETSEFAQSIAGDDLVMKKVSKKLAELSSDEKMIGLYDAEIEDARIKRTQMLSAQRQGLSQGLSQGIRQGIEQNKKEIAKNMLTKDMSIDLIMEITGLTKKEIESLE